MLVQSETCCPKGQTHPRSSECDCGQIVSARPNNSDGMVSSSGGIRPPVSNLAPSPGRHVCNQVQLQTDQVCFSSTGSQCLGSGHSNSLLGELGHVCLSPSIVTGQSGQQTVRSSVPEGDPDSSGLAQHAVVLGSGGAVVPDSLCLPNHPDLVTQPFNKARHRDLISLNLHAWLLEPKLSRNKGSLAQWRHKLTHRRTSKTFNQNSLWGKVVRFCGLQISIYQTSSRFSPAPFSGEESSTQYHCNASLNISKRGNASLNISKDENLTRLLDSFHRDRPRGRRRFPSWNLSLVLHQLTKPPFYKLIQLT